MQPRSSTAQGPGPGPGSSSGPVPHRACRLFDHPSGQRLVAQAPRSRSCSPWFHPIIYPVTSATGPVLYPVHYLAPCLHEHVPNGHVFRLSPGNASGSRWPCSRSDHVPRLNKAGPIMSRSASTAPVWSGPVQSASPNAGAHRLCKERGSTPCAPLCRKRLGGLLKKRFRTSVKLRWPEWSKVKAVAGVVKSESSGRSGQK